MIMHASFPEWYSEDELGALRERLEYYEKFLPGFVSFGKQLNKQFALCVPLLGHSTARSSVTPSVYVVIGEGRNGKITCFRPDGKITAVMEEGKWKYVRGGWIEVRENPMFEATTGAVLPLDPAIMRAGAHTVYASNFIGKYFHSVIIPDFELKAHFDSVKLARSLNKKYESSFIKTLESWFKKNNFEIGVLDENNAISVFRTYESLKECLKIE